MDYKADKCNSLEQVLIDADKRPILLPFSLLKDITNDFSEERIIGRGGFADVYEGILKNGSVAVKKLSGAALVDEKSFNKEIISLETVKHKNIVRFLGYCADTQTQLMKHYGMPVMAEIRERLLCFEYMPNGSLDKYIKDPSQGLEWAIRYQIIKGICEGLHYLHSERIVHLDLKPGNILLDCNMVPKIADFGLSKCFTEKQNEMTMTTTSGTLGYMAPEFHCSKITFQLDIFSLGAIITEILTGTRGYFDVNNVVESWKARLQSGTWLEHVRVCAKIALNCMDLNPKKRPLTKDILDAFEELESEFGSIESNLSATHMSRSSPYAFNICPGNDHSKETKTMARKGTKKNEAAQQCSGSTPSILQLRPGMILLKNFVKPEDQVAMVRACQHLGVGPGGFYQPGYPNGAQMQQQMMCLGLNWDPCSRSYGATRSFDGAQAPAIPEDFKKIVAAAIAAAKEVPPINPDICVVNFYEKSGELGLHQDKDESRSSINRDLPVVSISIGDTAEFLFSDTRSKEKASKIDLDSGDVLIFGGESRLVFHGISNRKPHITPAWLKEETSLRPGRLNLMFRQY